MRQNRSLATLIAGIAGMTALTMGMGQEGGNGHKDVPASRIPETNGV